MRAWSVVVLLPWACWGCGDAVFVAEEVLPPGTELKVVAWTDGDVQGAVLRDAADVSSIPLGPSLEAGRTLRLTVFPFTRAELDAAVPGLVGQSRADIAAGVEARFGAPIRMPGAAAVLEAAIDDDDAGPVEYTAIPRATWDAAVAAGDKTAAGLTVSDALACRLVQPLEVVDLPSRFAPVAVAGVDPSRAVVVGATGTTTLALLDVRAGGAVVPIPVTAASLGRPLSLGWDPTTSTLWGRDDRARVFRLGLDGRAVDFPPPPHDRARVVEVGRDGTVMMIANEYGPEGSVLTDVLDPRLGTWSTHASLRNLPRVGQARAFGRDRFMADINCHTTAWAPRGETGTYGWGDQGNTDGCTFFPLDMALDGSQYLWLGYHGILRRGLGASDVNDDVWPEQAHAIAVTSSNKWPLALAAMGEERFAVAGTRGQLEVWIGDRWCVPEGSASDVRLALGAGVEGGAWFVGTDAERGVPQSRARVVRVSLGQ